MLKETTRHEYLERFQEALTQFDNEEITRRQLRVFMNKIGKEIPYLKIDFYKLHTPENQEYWELAGSPPDRGYKYMKIYASWFCRRGMTRKYNNRKLREILIRIIVELQDALPPPQGPIFWVGISDEDRAIQWNNALIRGWKPTDSWTGWRPEENG